MKTSFLYTECVAARLCLHADIVTEIQYEVACEIADKVFSEAFKYKALKSKAFHLWVKQLCNWSDFILTEELMGSDWKATNPKDNLLLFKNNYHLLVVQGNRYPPIEVMTLIAKS